jgi:uncharacterized Zn finger protein (UPF0148 family)
LGCPDQKQKEENRMFCPQCGAPNEEDAVFCGNCGAVLDADELSAEPADERLEAGVAAKAEEAAEEEVPSEWQELEPDTPASAAKALPAAPAPPSPPAPARSAAPAAVQTSGMAIASLVMGIVGWTVLPLLGSILAIVFGYAARNEIRRRPGELSGDGLAMTGLVLGWLMVGISVLALCLGALGLCFFFGLAGANA